MLADARAGKFDVILAWREDRLYRSYRPMLDVLECLEETGLDIELAKETFDKTHDGRQGMVAKMELDASMIASSWHGRASCRWQSFELPRPIRLHASRDVYQTHEDEAYWVRKMFEWCASGIGTLEVRGG